MFQRFSSILFGDPAEDVGVCGGCPVGPGFNEKEDDDDEWILVDLLAEACARPRSDGLVEVCLPEDVADCPARYSSCSSLDSDAEADMESEADGFLRLDATSCSALEESWFVTPPPCFTAGGRGVPLTLETSPLENLLIEHPSMSVYTVHSSPPPRLRPAKDPPARETPSILRSDLSSTLTLCRAETQRRPSHHTGCYAAALAARAGFLEQAKHGRLAQRVRDGAERQQLSRNALRRLNLLRHGGTRPARHAKASAGHTVHQPGQRQFNY